MIQLLRLDSNTIINPDSIVEITVENLNNLRKERGQNYQTQEQIAQLSNKFWEVSVYLKSCGNGYNPQRYTQRFLTEQDANLWIDKKFAQIIVNKL